MTLVSILENLVSDAIFVALAILGPWIWFYFSRRRKLQGFFRTSDTNKLVVYLSALKVLPFGATGTLGKKLSYQGDAVAYGEMQGANQIKSLFSFIIPKLAETFQGIGTMFLSDATVETIISPSNKEHLETKASFIALGSAAYNVAAAYIEDLSVGKAKFQLGSMTLSTLVSEHPLNPPIVFSDSDPEPYPRATPGTIDSSIRVPITTPSGDWNPYLVTGSFTELPGSGLLQNAPDARRSEADKPSAILVDGFEPITDTTYGLIERIIEPKANRALFYVAGLSEFSTTAASYYLAAHWYDLYKKYGQDKSFIVLLRFEPSDPKMCTILLERDLSQ